MNAEVSETDDDLDFESLEAEIARQDRIYLDWYLHYGVSERDAHPDEEA